jgi:trehalose-6-phosphatase
LYRGYDVVEVQLVPGEGKSAGVRRLCRLADWNPTGERIVYAGDDENDAVAIRWVLSKGGSGIVVGNRITVPRALHVENPAGLARAVREFAEKSLRRDLENGREVSA